MLPTTTAPPSDANWDDVAPFLDEAIASLGATDRHAILLRFFERKELKEVGGAIGATEEAAKKRVGRALEKIRSFLARRGIALSAAALGTVITANAMPAVSPAISQSITAALAGPGITASTTLAALTMKAMFYAKLRFASSIAALFLVAAGAGALIAVSSADSRAAAPNQAASPSPQPIPAPKPPPPSPAPPAKSGALVWDAEQKEYKAGAGETTVLFSFSFTNTSASEVVINRVQPSCGCTTTKNLPSLPWRLPGGAHEQIDLVVNLTGKSGTLVKSVLVDTSAGSKSLLLRVEIPAGSATNGTFTVLTEAARAANLQTAAADRQAIFKGDCAKCHVAPAAGQTGRELYASACGICHDAEHRASMVPDLRTLPHPTTSEFWKTLIAQGKPGTLMPAFAQEEGGNLNNTQINSLVQYLVQTIPSSPQTTKTAQAR